ncbi:MAG: filamentous hemagglutinin N-terminal domain-containing protein [Gammaproteobacteria bacterium]|nr:filamentous hemagglutinin N-terminal domain-containing protein [Gammaproteobacteria bacterium]
MNKTQYRRAVLPYVRHGLSAIIGPVSISNIISRVTGSSNTTIDGVLRSTIPGANVYLLNPNGIMIGDNAKLNISGSFYASTADYLKLGTNGRFDASNPGNSVLVTAAPAAFGFLGSALHRSV